MSAPTFAAFLALALTLGRCAPRDPLDTGAPLDSGEPADSSGACSPLRWYVDGDGYGYGYQDPDGPVTWFESCEVGWLGRSPWGNDCDDADPGANPQAADPAGDGLDTDCDGADG